MKNLIILIILGVAGYFAYQYFMGSAQQASTTVAPTFNMFSLPEKCQRHGENLKDAFYRNSIGELKTVEVNGYTKNLRRCLRTEGYTNEKIDEAYDGIKNSR